MKITHTIADNKIAEFKLGFLKFHPVPLDENSNPIMSEGAWIKEWGKRKFMSAYKNGKSLLAMEASNPQTDLIT